MVGASSAVSAAGATRASPMSPIVAPPFIKPRIAVVISDTGLTSTKAWSDGLVQLGSVRQSWREPSAFAHFRPATA
jgi:hypothetical protein